MSADTTTHEAVSAVEENVISHDAVAKPAADIDIADVIADAIDIDRLSIEDLEALMKRVETAIRLAKVKRVSDLRRQVEATAAALDISVAELVGLERPSKATKRPALRGKVAPKYRNPEHPDQTWTGRGQKPVWLREHINQGAKIEDFLIDSVRTV